jgi:hypothetical protein
MTSVSVSDRVDSERLQFSDEDIRVLRSSTGATRHAYVLVWRYVRDVLVAAAPDAVAGEAPAIWCPLIWPEVPDRFVVSARARARVFAEAQRHWGAFLGFVV